MKTGKTKQGQESSSHGQATRMTKGCAAFFVGQDGEARQRFAVSVTLLGHPAIVELLAEAWEKYGYTHKGAIVVPCSVERFQRAVNAARAQERHHHHHHFRLPHLVRYPRSWRTSHGEAKDRETEEGEAPRRFAVPVALLCHPLILELLGEARDKYGYAHEGAIVVPCGIERFQKAVDAARAQERHRHHHHHHFSLPHLVGCFRPSHAVA
ncbi:hypothetical protein TRIUR3_27400 [Triticum urartu]|uniref:Auxin-responsive protein SAUR32 n=1 Tax=Triticum urartu TaxID=4572 RepID=M7ZC44_TRIUA|nr:hypothetical protein TRIUR3_27400 [Triticum urartu]